MRQAGSSPSLDLFTSFVRSLVPGDEPDAERLLEVWDELRGLLRRELRRRGLWMLPTSYLGIIGAGRWPEAPGALDELTDDCYVAIFVRRLGGLRAQAEVKPTIDGLVRRNVRNFVSDLQRSNDPLGTRVYAVLSNAVDLAMADGQLGAEPSGGRLQASTVLCFSNDRASDPRGSDELQAEVAPWNDELLPDLVTATGRGYVQLVEKARDLVLGLQQRGIEAFCFGDLVSPLRKDLRQRWARIAEGSGPSFEALSEMAVAAADLEQRESFRNLVHCVQRSIARHPGGVEERERLRSLWDFLVHWAATGSARAPGDDQDERVPRSSAPSQRELSEWLKIPRAQVSTLFQLIKKFADSCRDDSERSSEEPTSPSESSGDRSAMDRKTRSQTLGQMTARALSRSQEQRRATAGSPDEGLRVGGVYALRGDALRGDAGEWFEWVLLALMDGRAVIAPADSGSLAGRFDLALSEDSSGGPLTLRCGLAEELPGGILESAACSRTVSSAAVSEALELVRRAGSEPPAEPSGPVELDPDYRELMARAAEAVESLRRDRVPGGRARGGDPGYRLSRGWLAAAACFALLSVGLLLWNGHLRGVIERQNAPSVLAPDHPVRVSVPPRQPEKLHLARDEAEVVLLLSLESVALDCRRLRIDLLGERGGVLAQLSHQLPRDRLTVALRLPRAFVERNPTKIEVWEICAGEQTRVDRRGLEVTIAP